MSTEQLYTITKEERYTTSDIVHRHLTIEEAQNLYGYDEYTKKLIKDMVLLINDKLHSVTFDLDHYIELTVSRED